MVLIGAYAAVMIAAALWLPHEWDWGVWDWLSSRHAPAFDAAEIAIVDVPWDPGDVSVDRRRIAAFLKLMAARKQNPGAVILDVQFGPCQTKPCGEPMESARRELIAAIRTATASFPVYALEQPVLRTGDEAAGIEPHDPDVYAALSGAAHSKFTALTAPSGLFYRACYNVPVLDASGNLEGVRPVWDMVERVSMRGEVFTHAVCDTNHVPVRLPPDPVAPAEAAVVKLDARGGFPASADFEKKYVIVGSIEQDHPLDTPLRGPELLAWALSDALDPGTASGAERAYDTEPQGATLLVLVPAFSALAVTTYVAIFFLLKGTQLRALRRALPWIAAAAAAVAGLAALAAFEGWLLSSGHIQPQVTLIALGIVLAALLSSLRAFQYLFEQTWSIETAQAETYDYDVFISYAHEEGAWVFEHVYAPLRDARLPDGRKLSIFFDTESIRYGTAWQDKITLAIEGSRFVVPVYSETYFSRPYCTFEIRRAHLKWIKAGPESRCVLPIMRGNPKIPATVADIQAKSVDEVPDLVERVVAEIVERLARLGPPAASGTPNEATAT